MKNQLKIRLLEYLVSEKRDSGLVITGLPSFIVGIGIISAILLPSLLNQSNRAKESEALVNISTVNKQQAIFFTTNGKFATDFNTLALPNLNGGSIDSTSSKYYIYSIETVGKFPDDTQTAYIFAIPKSTVLKSAGGGIVRMMNSDGIAILETTICQAKAPGAKAPTKAQIRPDAALTSKQCGADFDKI